MTITEYLDSIHVAYKTKGKNIARNWIGMQCLYCYDKSYHLGVNLKNGRVFCWKCGGKSLKKLIQDLSECSYREALKIEESLVFEEIEEKQERRISLDSKLLEEFYTPISDSCKKYLQNRNFDATLLERKYSLMSAEIYSKYKYRLIIPIIMQNQIIAFTARDVTSRAELRYLSCSDKDALKPKSHWVYNIDSVRDTVIVTEGCTDVWRLGDGAVALMGTGFSDGQIQELLLRKIKRVFVMFDAEEEAQKRAISFARRISPFVETVELSEIDSGDPAELSEDDVRHFRKEIKI